MKTATRTHDRQPVQWPATAPCGARITATTADGLYEGRLVSITTDLMRLKWGAGMWDIRRRDVVHVEVTDPTPAIAVAPTSDQQRAQARRILARWP